MDDEQEEYSTLTWRSLNLLPCSSELERTDPKKASRLYERVLQENPGSYKLWHAYLSHKTRQLDAKQLDDPIYQDVTRCFERALAFMHRMPRIWIEYCTLMDRQFFVTKTRKAFDKALEALPITQHSRIWPLYLEFVKKPHVPVETAIRVFKRYLQLKPDDAETFIDYLHSKNYIDQATATLCDIINRPKFQSKHDKTKYQLWEELCEMICDHADQIHSVDAEAVLRDGIARYRDQQGRLWNSLARFYIQLGMFSTARSVYDEAIHTVMTKKDFVEVWEAYSNFEEKFLERLLEVEDPSADDLVEIEMRQALLEELITNNGLLLNRVALRQNPHNVREWQKRVQLCEPLEGMFQLKEETFAEAIKTIDPKQALGNYEDLWIDYASFYADLGRIQRARNVFEEAIEANFVKNDDLAKVWCAYVELELKDDPERALRVAKRGIAAVKNIRLWSIYTDLEENFGNFNSTKAAYERILDLKIATPQIVLNYAAFLEEKEYYEDSFRVYERGTSLFRWPNSTSIWNTYLYKFMNRYGSRKLDRARDLFEQALKDCPYDQSFHIYVLYAKLEEDRGLLSRAQAIYKRGASRVEAKHKADIYKIYIRSMMKLADMSKIRAIYEEAIADLPNSSARSLCLEYASLEEDLGQIDRARTIYNFCSQMCNPKVDKEFWKLWADFEQRHGTLETIDDMLRAKRSVQWAMG